MVNLRFLTTFIFAFLFSVIGYGQEILLNGGFESSTSKWAAYCDAAGVAPVDGVGGGVAGFAISASTTTPLSGKSSGIITKDAANRQGCGVATSFTLANENKAKVLQINLTYQVASGTYSDDQYKVYVYDVDNSTLIEAAPTAIKNSTIAEKYRGVFQATMTGVNYRLIIHNASTNAVASTMRIEASVSSQVISRGSFVGDWKAFTPTGTWVTNASYSGFYRQVGDSLEVDMRIAVSGAVTGNLTVNLPSGLTIDTSKLSQASSGFHVDGTVQLGDSGVGTYFASLVYNSSTSISVSSLGTNSVQTGASASAPYTWASGDNVRVNYKVPIVGWSSGTQISSDSDTRVVALEATGSSTSISGSDTVLTWTTTSKDTHGAFNGTIYTVPVSGFYDVSVSVRVDHASIVAGQQAACGITKNGANWAYAYVGAGWTSNTIMVPYARKIGYFNAGDLIRTVANGGGTTPSISAQSFYTNFSIARVSGPSAIAATETIAAHYSSSTGQTLTAGGTTTILYPTKDFDTHSAVSSGIFTAPSKGLYQFNAGINISAQGSGATRIIIQANKTGSLATRNVFTTVTAGNSYTISDSVQMNAGDTLKIEVNTDATGSITLSSEQSRNFFSVLRVGF